MICSYFNEWIYSFQFSTAAAVNPFYTATHTIITMYSFSVHFFQRLIATIFIWISALQYSQLLTIVTHRRQTPKFHIESMLKSTKKQPQLSKCWMCRKKQHTTGIFDEIRTMHTLFEMKMNAKENKPHWIINVQEKCVNWEGQFNYKSCGVFFGRFVFDLDAERENANV